MIVRYSVHKDCRGEVHCSVAAHAWELFPHVVTADSGRGGCRANRLDVRLIIVAVCPSPLESTWQSDTASPRHV